MVVPSSQCRVILILWTIIAITGYVIADVPSFPLDNGYPSTPAQELKSVDDLLDSINTLIDNSEYKKAEDEIDQVLSLEPDNAFAWFYLAECLTFREGGDGEETLDTIIQAIYLFPEDGDETVLANFYTLKSIIERDLEMYEEALESVDTARSELSPERRT